MRRFSAKQSFLTIVLFFGIMSIYAPGNIKANLAVDSTVDTDLSNPGSSLEVRPFPFHHFLSLGAIQLYQLLISPSKGSSCPMHPHCSLFAQQAFKKFNPIKAFLLTADRLHRCGHDLDNYRTVEVVEFARFFDPVDPLGIGKELNLVIETQSKGRNQSTYAFRNADVTGRSFAEDSLSEESRLFHFGERMQLEGDYDRAITEYRRLLFYFPNSSYREQALKSIFFCYYHSGEYLLAVHWGQDILHRGMSPVDENEVKFYIGDCYFKLGNFSLARNYLKEASASEDGIIRDKSFLLEGLAYANETNWEEAEKSFASISPDSKFSDKAKECEKLSLEGKKLSLKSPTVAGVLGIIPGLGYLYDGYEQTALSSFLVNSLFIWGTVEAFRQDSQSLGVMLGVLSFGWYAGNIYGSVISAQRKNLKLKSDLLLKFDVGFKF